METVRNSQANTMEQAIGGNFSTTSLLANTKNWYVGLAVRPAGSGVTTGVQ